MIDAARPAVTLQFLGSGDAFGSGGRLQTCLRLSGASEASVLVDCGTSSLIALKRAAVDPGDIGWVLLTHLHGDHFGGIPFHQHRPDMLARQRESAFQCAEDGLTISLQDD